MGNEVECGLWHGMWNSDGERGRVWAVAWNVEWCVMWNEV